MFTALRVLLFPVKVGVGTAKVGAKAGYRTGRLVGYRRVAVLLLGVGVGLLIAPMTGRELRTRLRDLLDGRAGNGTGDLADKVRFELSHAPRTWHLVPQPDVEVHGSTAILRGVVRDDAARIDLERTAAAVAGVGEVDNQLAVATPGTNGTG